MSDSIFMLQITLHRPDFIISRKPASEVKLKIVEISLYLENHSLAPLEFSMINQQKLIDTFCDKVSHFDPPEY